MGWRGMKSSYFIEQLPSVEKIISSRPHYLNLLNAANTLETEIHFATKEKLSNQLQQRLQRLILQN